VKAVQPQVSVSFVADDQTWLSLSLLLHRASCRFTEYHITNNGLPARETMYTNTGYAATTIL